MAIVHPPVLADLVLLFDLDACRTKDIAAVKPGLKKWTQKRDELFLLQLSVPTGTLGHIKLGREFIEEKVVGRRSTGVIRVCQLSESNSETR